MASSARIDELRKKFDENPRRYFAPLANEYRKAGDLDQAIFICQQYLPSQPGHMSGHIVYGQALFEAMRRDESRTVFETALSLDPENLIALRHLGDIARDGGDLDGARNWYKRVLEADPRNEEIASLLERLLVESAPRIEAEFVPAPATSSDDIATEDFPVSEDVPVSSPETDVIQDVAGEVYDLPIGSDDPSAVNLDEVLPATAAESIESPVVSEQNKEEDLLQFDELLFGARGDDHGSWFSADAEEQGAAPGSEDFDSLPDIDLADSGDESSETVADLEVVFEADPYAMASTPANDAEPSVVEAEVVAEGVDADEGGEFVVESVIESEAVVDHEDFAEMPVVEAVTIDDAELLEPAAIEEPLVVDDYVDVEDEPSAADSSVTSEMFVTETMAELYLQQGHMDSALDIYKKLVAMRPDDEGLCERMRAVEARISGVDEAHVGPTIREYLVGLVRFPDGAVAVEAPEAAITSVPSNTVAGSIDALFSGAEPSATDDAAASALAGAFASDSPDHDSADDSAIRGQPARRAADELSLDHVFRPGRTPTPATGQSAFSFDAFFADEGTVATDDEGAAGESDEASGPADDIAQFNAWLNGLKKT